ncbi:MAG: fibronectin type III domain-containing protein [Phycisphaerales bacterium]|nr:fibronectin type III domain-containing protein [Phycisphaerales bacterium]
MSRPTRKPARKYQHFLETLESRTMLSVSTADFAAIQSQYPDLGLTNFADYTIYEVGGTEAGAGQKLFAFNAAGLWSAIDAAKTSAPSTNTLIVVRTGTATAQNTITLSGTELDVDIDTQQYGSVTIVSLGAMPLTIDAVERSGIFSITSESTVALGGLTITNGNGSGIYNDGTLTVVNSTICNNTTGSGGGIYNDYGALTVMDCIISNNTTNGYGGGIYSSGQLTVTNSTISDNIASYSGGGGIENDGGTLTVTNSTIINCTSFWGGGGLDNSGTLTVTNSTISSNTEYNFGGGGICNRGQLTMTNSTILNNSSNSWGGGICTGFGGTATIMDCTISNNRGYCGGGIDTGGTTTIMNCMISNNMCGFVGGGGIRIGNDTTVINCVIVDNISNGGYGGGILIDNGDVTVTNSKIAGNSSSDGGGIYDANQMTVITNSLIAGNSASDYGGGIYGAGTMTVTNSTIAGNYAYCGGGIYNTDNLTVNNTIIAKNISDYSSFSNDIFNDGGTMTGYHSLVGDDTVLGGYANGNLIGTDPKFVSFTLYTTWTADLWTTWDLRLASDSPAINAGSNALAVDADGYPLQTDYNGNVRIAGGTVDMGAYEYGASSVTKLTMPTGVTATSKDGTTITINWNTVSNASGYRIQCATDAGFTQNVKTQTISGGTVKTVDMTGLYTGYQYYVRVLATGTGSYVNSDYSISANVVPTPTPLPAPTGVAASSKNATTLTINWNAVSNASSYTIQYATDAGFTQNVWTQNIYSGTAQTADINYLTTGVTYYVRVMAITGTYTYSNSSYSSSVNATPTAATTQLAVPTGVTATNKNATTLTVNWNAVSNASGYIIQYATDASFTQNVKTQSVSGGTTKTADITGLMTGTTYYVRVMATGTGNYSNSPYSGSANATPASTGSTTPTGAQIGSDYNPAKKAGTLTWNAVANATGYQIMYSNDGGITWKTKNVKNVTSLKLSGITPDVIVRVYAITASGTSSSYSQAPAIVKDMPNAPTNARISSDYNPAKKAGTLTWSAVANATGYVIQYSNDGGITWKTKKVKNVTSLKLTGITPDVIVRVYATNAWGTSTGYSQAPAIVKDLPNAPTNAHILSDYDSAKKTGTLTWSAVSNATGYMITYSNDGFRTWKTKTVKNITSLKLTGIAPGTIVRVYAINAWGTSTGYSSTTVVA